MENEVFKNCAAAGFSRYEVSNLGKLRRIGNEKIIIKPGNDKQGYQHYRITHDTGGIKLIKAHRLVATVWLENTFNKKIVDHIDGNRKNNEVNNLRWCTSLENANFNNARITREKNGRRYYYDILNLETGYLFEHADSKTCNERFGIGNPNQVARRAGKGRPNIFKGKYQVTFSR